MTIPKWVIVILFGAALVGLGDAAYLTAQHLQGVIPPCGALQNCETVLTSSYASVGPIPVAGFGVLYYGLVLALLIAYLDTRREGILRLFVWLVSVGMLVTLGLIAIMAFVLEAWCPYCLISALSTTTLFIVGIWYTQFRTV